MRTATANIEAVVFTLIYPEDRMNSTVTVPTVSEEEIRGRITVLPATPENIQSRRSGVGFHDKIEGVSGNGSSGWYFPPPGLNNSGGGKGRRNRIRMSTEDLV